MEVNWLETTRDTGSISLTGNAMADIRHRPQQRKRRDVFDSVKRPASGLSSVDNENQVIPVGTRPGEKHRRQRTASLKDLGPADKKRIANLIQELARLGDEKEQVDVKLKTEREHFEQAKMQLLQEQQKLISERHSVQQELAQCQNMLLRFQQEVLNKLEASAASQAADALTSSALHSPSTSERSRASDVNGGITGTSCFDGESDCLSKTLEDYIDSFDRANAGGCRGRMPSNRERGAEMGRSGHSSSATPILTEETARRGTPVPLLQSTALLCDGDARNERGARVRSSRTAPARGKIDSSASVTLDSVDPQWRQREGLLAEREWLEQELVRRERRLREKHAELLARGQPMEPQRSRCDDKHGGGDGMVCTHLPASSRKPEKRSSATLTNDAALGHAVCCCGLELPCKPAIPGLPATRCREFTMPHEPCGRCPVARSVPQYYVPPFRNACIGEGSYLHCPGRLDDSSVLSESTDQVQPHLYFSTEHGSKLLDTGVQTESLRISNKPSQKSPSQWKEESVCLGHTERHVVQAMLHDELESQADKTESKLLEDIFFLQ